MKSDNFKAALQEHNKFINEEIQMIENGAKVSLLRKEIKPRERDLRKELMTLVSHVSKTGEIAQDLWPQYRNLLAILIKQTLDKYHSQFQDSKTFEEEKQIILQYIVYFDRPPFTIQRISELTLEPEKYYRSCKKILYAYEKLVNVSDPEDR